MKDGHHYQLLHLVNQRILSQYRMKYAVADEWVVILVHEIYAQLLGIQAVSLHL